MPGKIPISWVKPEDCVPPHRVSHPDKMVELANKFFYAGWGHKQDSLVGYRVDGMVQLLSGTHRHAAATMAELPVIPVVIHTIENVRAAVGNLESWADIMSPAIVVDASEAK